MQSRSREVCWEDVSHIAGSSAYAMCRSQSRSFEGRSVFWLATVAGCAGTELQLRMDPHAG